MRKTSVLFISVCFLMMGLLAACGENENASTNESNNSEEDNSTNESDVSTVEDGQFTFGFSGLLKPFNFENLDGDLDGFEVELGEAIAEEMGLEPNPVATQDFGALIEEVNSDRLDAIIGSLTITEERAEEIDFSDPYYLSGGMVFVHEDNDEIQSVEDLEGKNVGVITSSTYEDIVLDYMDEDDLATYQSDNVALEDLSSGSDRLDAVMTDKFVGLQQIEENDLSVKAVGDLASEEEIAVGVKKGNTELLDEVNSALETVIEDGTHEEISEKWFDENILEK